MKTDVEIDALLRSFEDCTLGREAWTHREHLIVALCYVRRYSRQEATDRMRQNIQRFNLSHGNPNGYHETITLAWIAVITRFCEEQPDHRPMPSVVKALLEECGEKHYLLRYYSKDRLMSDTARRTWVPPDLQALE
jgi:hypothetical protein